MRSPIFEICLLAAFFGATVPTLDVSIAGASHPWVAVYSLLNDIAPQQYEGVAKIAIPSDAPVLVCAGGEDRATQCRRFAIDAGTRAQFTLAAGLRVAGKISVGRDPAPKATVTVTPARIESRRTLQLPLSRDHGALVYATTTKSDGSFAFEHLDAGDYAFEAHLAGGRVYTSEVTTVAIPRRSASRTFALPEFHIDSGVTLDVHIAEKNGKALEHVTVAVVQTGSEYIVEADHANAHVSGLAPSVAGEVTCIAAGYARVKVKFDTPPKSLQCVLEPLASLRGRIRDAARTPIRDAVVSLRPGGLTAHSDPKGIFAIKDIVPREYRVRVAGQAMKVWSKPVTVEAGDDRDLGEIELEPGTAIRGVVVDAATHAPVVNASITMTDVPGGSTAVSDEHGLFTLTGDFDGGAAIEVRAPRYGVSRKRVSAPASDEAAPIEVALVRSGVLEVIAWDDDRETDCSACTINVFGGIDDRSGRTNGQGFVRFEDLTPDSVSVVRERVQAGGSSVRVSGGEGMQIATIRSGETTRVELGKHGSTIRITTTPAAEAAWRLSARCASMSSVVDRDSTGTFTIRRSHGERCALSLVRGSEGVTVAAVSEDFSGSSMNIALSAGGVRGVLTRDSLPVAGAALELTSAAGAIAWGVSQGRGVVEFHFVPPGVYALVAGGRTMRSAIVVATRIVDLGEVPLK
jgi:hypothetical protein